MTQENASPWPAFVFPGAVVLANGEVRTVRSADENAVRFKDNMAAVFNAASLAPVLDRFPADWLGIGKKIFWDDKHSDAPPEEKALPWTIRSIEMEAGFFYNGDEKLDSVVTNLGLVKKTGRSTRTTTITFDPKIMSPFSPEAALQTDRAPPPKRVEVNWPKDRFRLKK